MKYQYLMLIIGVVLIIAGLWLSYRKPLVEGLADTSLIVMVGSTGSNLHYADQGLTNSPNWKAVGGGLTQMSGSYGRLIGVNGTSVYYGTQYDIPGSPFKWVSVPGAMTQVSFEYPLVVGVDTAGLIKYIDNIAASPTTATWKQNSGELASKTFKWVSTSLGRAYAIGTDNKIWYVNNARTGSWIDVTGSLIGKTFTQVAFDANQVIVLDSANKVYYADSNYTTNTSLIVAPNWTDLPGAIKHISLTNNMAVGMGVDNNVYFASNAKVGNWITLSKPTNFIFVEILYPIGANMITQRPADMAPCTSGYSFYNGFCGQPCPSGYTTNQFICNGIPIPRSLRAATIVPPTYFTCPSGFDVDLTGLATCKKIVEGTVSVASPVKEVFYVEGSYTQAQAKGKCTAYGTTRATTAQLTSAQAGGADWCTGGWVSDNTSAVLYPRGGCEAGAPGVISAPIRDGLAPANCYGIKPPQNQYTDIKPFKTGGSWNQGMQCPVGHNVNTNGTCNSTCPTGAWGEGASCVFPVVSKDFVPASSINYTCPAGYDQPTVVICSGGNCGPAQTCYATCPAGLTAMGPSCAGAITQKKTAQAAAPVRTGITCPIGHTLSGTTCYAPCDAGDTSPNPTSCLRRTMTPLGPKVTTYNKATSAATVTFGPYTCPVGWTLTGQTCYQDCAAGTTDIGNNQCQATGTTRATVQATYIPPCPTGTSLVDGKCYRSCPSGTTEVSATTCQAASLRRTTTTANPIKSTLTPCNSNEETFTGETSQSCSQLCPSKYISSQTSCTPPTTTRTNYAAKYSCNKNETLENGACLSKCAEGSYPNGELCMASEQIVPAPSSIKCTSTPYLKGKKWMCDTQADLDALLKGPSATTTYVGNADQVCISDDPTTGMYFCESGTDAKNNTGAVDTIRDSYSRTCSSVTKNYLDLSGSLTSLILIQSGMSNGSTQLTTAQTALRSIYSQLNCASPPNAQVTTLCNQIQSAATAIGLDTTNINNILMNITVPIQAALSSRSSLLASIKNFQCPL
jgi:hypothetical protein